MVASLSTTSPTATPASKTRPQLDKLTSVCYGSSIVSARTASVELFAYPWDILDCGIPRFVDECRELGVDKLHVTTLYHSGKFLLHRNQTSRVYFPEPGCLHIPLPENSFGGAIRPPAGRLASSSWLEDLCRAARSAGLSLAAWTVF